MIEAVNSVLSNAPFLKAAAERQSSANSFAANPDQLQQVSAQAPYVSLYIKVDVKFDKAILQLRDGDTGDVVQQIPSESQLEAYRRAQKVVAPKLSDIVAPKEDAGLSSSSLGLSGTQYSNGSDTDLDAGQSSPSVAPVETKPVSTPVDTSA